MRGTKPQQITDTCRRPEIYPTAAAAAAATTATATSLAKGLTHCWRTHETLHVLCLRSSSELHELHTSRKLMNQFTARERIQNAIAVAYRFPRYISPLCFGRLEVALASGNSATGKAGTTESQPRAIARSLHSSARLEQPSTPVNHQARIACMTA